jgi:peptidoglycan/LPS O-acetylase OafA/YrhL
MSLRKPSTFLDRMQAANGRSSGFDYMRVLLAAAIIVLHGVMTSYGSARQDELLAQPWGRPLLLLVPMFFALSGFLVAGSWERCRTIVSFLGLRILRIFPALVVQVILSALIVGAIFTTYPLKAYFHDPLFARFFLNAVGDPQYLLPGVFWNNPDKAVNGQLWTVPFEIGCYLILTVMALAGVLKRRWVMLGALALVQAGLAFHAFWRPHGMSLPMGGMLTAVCFMWGLCLYRFRDKVPWGPWLTWLALGASIGAMMLPNGKYIGPLPVAYFTCSLGLMNPPRNRWLLGGDYSYGLYIFGYPIQQAVASFPELRIWWLNVLIALPCTMAIAVASWWWVESRALALRGRLVDLEDRLVTGLRRFRPLEPRDTVADAPTS